MAKRKVKSYEVLVNCRNDKTGKAFKVGDTVKTGDFPAAVIKAWMAMGKPVLKETK